MRFLYRLGDGSELVGCVLVEFVILIDALHGNVGGDFHDVQFVDVEKFLCFGRSSTGHSRNLGVHAEIVLEGNCRQRLVFRLDTDTFLRLDRLMQTIGPTASIHHAPGEFVNNDHFVILDDIIGVPLEHDIGFQCLVKMMDDLRIFIIVKVCSNDKSGCFEQALSLFGAFLGQDDAARLFVLFVIAFFQLQDDLMNCLVQFRPVVGRARDDQRRPRFVDQDRVDFVDNCEVERALHHLRPLMLHVIAQIIEA